MFPASIWTLSQAVTYCTSLFKVTHKQLGHIWFPVSVWTLSPVKQSGCNFLVCTSLGICCQHKAGLKSTSKPKEPQSCSTCYSEDVRQLIHSLSLSNHLGRIGLKKLQLFEEKCCYDFIWALCVVGVCPVGL